MKKLIMLILCCLSLGGCAVGTYDKPLIPESVQSDDKEHATVVFYVSDALVGAISRLGNDFIAVIDETEFKQTYPISQMMIANSKGYSVTKLSPGIHTFWLNSWGKETANLEACAIYYLSVRFTIAGGYYIRFMDKDNFLEEADDAVEIRLTKGFDRSKFDGGFEYEIVK